jgi:moderate conductance mechanosensitive channel
MLTRLLGADVRWGVAIAAVAAAVLLSWIAASVAARLVRAVLLKAIRGRAAVPFSAPIVRAPVRVVRACVFLLVGVTLIVPALELAGAQIEAGLHLHTLATWLLRSGLRVLLIIALAYVVIRSVSLFTARLEAELAVGDAHQALERAKRARTLGDLLRNVTAAVVGSVAVLMALQELDINILPILTGAGVVGLAVGFGAQTLVRDIISGFFLILEDQVRVGDVVTIGPTSGLVEALNLRTIVLRDLTGTVHVIPNGSIDRLSNETKDYSYYLVDLGVAYREDTDEVAAVASAVAAELKRDPAYGPSMLEPLEVLGVEAFAESQVTVRMRLKTLPLKQWDVGREFRRRLKKALDARGVEIPFPQRIVHIREVKTRSPELKTGSPGPSASQ